MRVISAGFFVLSFLGCSVPDEPNEAALKTSRDIQGTNPQAAIFAVFGAVEADGLGAIRVFASDNPDPCAQLGADPVLFVVEALDGRLPGTFALVSANIDGGLPVAGDVVLGRGGLRAVRGIYAVSDGISALGGSTSAGEGELTVNEFTLGESFSAEFSGVIDLDLQENPIAPGVEMLGSLVSIKHCQALTDVIGQL